MSTVPKSRKLQKLYPRVMSRGIPVTPGMDGIPDGIPGDAIRESLDPEEFTAWCDWADGITMGMNGVYPSDLEAFLAGRPNLD